MGNRVVPDPNHYKSLKEIWQVCYTITSRSQSETEMLLVEAKKKRSELLVTSHELIMVSPRNSDEKITHAEAYSRAVNEITQYVMKQHAIGGLKDSVGRITEQEFQAFYKRGTCRFKNALKTVCINPTFLNPDTEQWQVDYFLCPFLGCLPLSQEELITSFKDKILLPTCQKILKNTVDSYRSRVADIQVFFHLEDALEFCFTDANKFDVIDCSNLVDRVGLANILNAASGKLRCLDYENENQGVEESARVGTCTAFYYGTTSLLSTTTNLVNLRFYEGTMLRPLGTILVRQADGSRFLTFGFKRNKMFSSAIGRSGAHRRKLRTTFGLQ